MDKFHSNAKDNGIQASIGELNSYFIRNSYSLTLSSPGFLKSVKPGGGGGIHPHPITPLFEG